MILNLLLLGFALLDLWTFVQGAPPMWATFHSREAGEWSSLLVALRLLESFFLVSLPVSATFLLMHSRWAIVLGIGQLPVRILCGYSLLPLTALAGTLGETGFPHLPWLPLSVLFEFLRIGTIIYALRPKRADERAHLGRPFIMRWPRAAASAVALTLILGWLHIRPGWPGGSSPQPTVEFLLGGVDENLFSNDPQPRLDSYSAIAVTWQGGEQPVSGEVDTLGPVHLGAYGLSSSIDWEPACGPWNLVHLVRFELGLFSCPWSETFGSEAWTDKTIVPMDGGWRLRFVPVDSVGGPADFNAPVVRGFQVWIDSTGVPRQGLCELDMKLFGARALLGFEFEEFQGRLRIQRILHQIDMANVRIMPTLDLRYREENGIVLFEGADFSVPPGQLSPTLGARWGGDHITRLRLLDYQVDTAKAR